MVFNKGDDVSADTFPLNVGLLMGVGGLGDQSFNDSAYLGLTANRW